MGLVGDPERERAAALLKRHYLRGRLSVEELAQRLDVALRARRESELRVALADLPVAWRDHAGGMRSAVSRTVRRTAFVLAVWALWWAASLVLLIGLVASIVVQGLTLTAFLVFPALWVACTLAAKQVARYGRRRLF